MNLNFGSNSHFQNSKYTSDSLVLDTADVTFACHVDTSRLLTYLYNHSNYDDGGTFYCNCIIYKNNYFVDTGFRLSKTEILNLSMQTPLSEFKLYSRFYKKHTLGFLNRKEKRELKFKGYTFRIYTRKIVYNKKNSQNIYCLWPKNDKEIIGLDSGYYMKDARLIK